MNSYFDALSLQQLQQLANRWFHVMQGTTGHEHEVMAYNMRQLWSKIMDLELPANGHRDI